MMKIFLVYPLQKILRTHNFTSNKFVNFTVENKYLTPNLDCLSGKLDLTKSANLDSLSGKLDLTKSANPNIILLKSEVVSLYLTVLRNIKFLRTA